MGNDTRPEAEESYNINQNWGFQVNFMVPLDREGLRQCKRIAKRQEEKMRLDYELVRALKCAELRQRGFTFHPQSEMVVLCQDVVPISALQPPKPKKKFTLSLRTSGQTYCDKNWLKRHYYCCCTGIYTLFECEVCETEINTLHQESSKCEHAPVFK